MQTDQQPPSLLAGHPWKPSDQTNVQETWKRFGWTPIHPDTQATINLAVIAEVGRTTHQTGGGV